MSCTWMTIIDSLFYAFGSLSLDVSWEYIPKLLVAWFFPHRHHHTCTKTIKFSHAIVWIIGYCILCTHKHQWYIKRKVLILIFVCLLGLCFNVPVNSYGHVETVSSPNHSFYQYSCCFCVRFITECTPIKTWWPWSGRTFCVCSAKLSPIQCMQGLWGLNL